MNTNIKWIIICCASLIGAFSLFAIRNDYIIFNFRSLRQSDNQILQNKKTIKLFYWNHDRWNKEDCEVIWSANTQSDISSIIKSWLVVVEEEKLIDKKINLMSALVSANKNEVYLSFDRNPFDDDQSTIKKLMLAESLLKTLRENNIAIKKVRFLKHHQTIWDHHLDFYHAWPIEGFLEA